VASRCLDYYRAKNDVSSCEIARSLGVTQKTAWFMLHRIRLGMQSGSLIKLGGNGGGEVEADETFISGKARNMHLSVKARRITGTGTKNKTALMGILERGGQVRTIVVFPLQQPQGHGRRRPFLCGPIPSG
jgi:ISXO2 transposase-like protein